MTAAAMWCATTAGAQVWNPPETVRATTMLRPEIRLDYLGGGARAVHAGIGLSARAGSYLRIGGNIGAGPDAFGGESDRAHGDATLQFLLDPYRRSRVGVSLGGGVSVRHQRELTRAFALLFADVEAGRGRGWAPFARAGLGGGARLTMGVRRAPAAER